MTSVTPPPPPTPSAAPASPATANAINPPPQLAALGRGASVEAIVVAQVSKNVVQIQTVLGTFAVQTTQPMVAGTVLTLAIQQLQPQVQMQIAALNGKPLPGAVTLPGALLGSDGSAPASTQGQSNLQAGAKLGATLLRPAVTSATPPTATPPASAATPGATPPVTSTPGTAPVTSAPATPGGGVANPQGASPANPQAAAQAATPATPQAPTQAGAQGAPQAAASATTQAPTQASSAQARTAGGATGQTPTAGGGGAATSGGSASSPSSATVSTSTPSTTILPAGSRLSLQVVRVDAPSGAPVSASSAQPGATPALLAKGGIINATVVGRTAGGQPIIQTPGATIALDGRGAIAIGSKITLEILTDPAAAKPPAAASAILRAGAGEALFRATGWNTLAQALSTLENADPARFQQVVQNTLPQPGTKLGAQLLFFLTALRGGDLRSWLGEAPSKLVERERPGTLARLGGEFQMMSKAAGEPSAGDWRLALIPLYNHERVEQIRLFQRRAKQNDTEDESGSKRFVLDFTLTRLGHFQIDGLVKADNSRVDLIIRTERPLDHKVQVEIGQIYNAAAELTGIGGGVAFQAAPGNFIEFPPLDPAETRDGLIV